MNILDANVLVNKTKKLNINCGSLALSLAKRKFLFIQSCDGLKKKCFVIFLNKCLLITFESDEQAFIKNDYRAFLESVTWWPWWNKETIMLKNVPNLIPPNFLFLDFIYLWLLYPLTAELFRFSLSKTSTQIRLLIKKKLRGTEHGNRFCRYHWQCAYAKYF